MIDLLLDYEIPQEVVYKSQSFLGIDDFITFDQPFDCLKDSLVHLVEVLLIKFEHLSCNLLDQEAQSLYVVGLSELKGEAVEKNRLVVLCLCAQS